MSKEKSLFRQSVAFSGYIILLLWLVKSIEWAFSVNFAHFGIYPRHFLGTIGIFTSPFIHGDFLHLLSNSFSLMLLIIILFFFYDKIALKALLYVYILTGICVWLIAREAYHIGASGVIYGIASFILFSGLLRKNQSSLALSFVVLLLYGGMFYGVLPQDGHISWESHLMGLASGLLVALFLKNEFAGQAELKLHFEKLDEDEDEFPDGDDSDYNYTSNSQTFLYQYTSKDNSSGTEPLSDNDNSEGTSVAQDKKDI